MHLLSIGVEGRCILSICALCYMWNLFGVTVFHRSNVSWSGGTCILSICAFCYMWNLFGVTVFHISMVNWSGGRCILSICAFCYMWNLFGVVVFDISMVNWIGGTSILKYMCILLYVETYLVFGVMVFDILLYLWSNGGRGYICQKYMSIVLYVKCIWCSSIWCIYLMHLWPIGVGGRCILSICAFCYMWNLFGVMVFHISMVK